MKDLILFSIFVILNVVLTCYLCYMIIKSEKIRKSGDVTDDRMD